MKQNLKRIGLALAAAFVIVYAFDWISVTYRIPGNREIYGDVRVDQVFTDTNKYKELEYSIGNTVTERCVYALFPHSGFRPCWYVTRHTMNVTNTD